MSPLTNYEQKMSQRETSPLTHFHKETENRPLSPYAVPALDAAGLPVFQ